jgi:HK97 gp10 family phage protein
MRIQIKLNSASTEILYKLRNLAGEKAIQSAFNISGAKIQKHAKNLQRNTPKTGRIYKYGNKIHIASSAGNAPAVITGKLLDSTDFEATGSRLTVGYTAPHGKYLELGTKKMKARPALRPSITTHTPTIGRDLTKAFKNEIEKCKK